ncbi:uncharacterized protein NESG_01678 [Nematocida ausubeli]|uniref:Thioredoxin domain-containing protein n=1 Tax=Nematocida ausubeli (strain ATCC PRA-371 / ERTm2) TaxID=1913371 RepID=A0A086J0N1_NEMA1|nr:uncharacterized protein NESG_01678 [Nematocida ausubeli]KFG25699.1 hypothetical protein NESG_01678 [Nematocida ausubeli]
MKIIAVVCAVIGCLKIVSCDLVKESGKPTLEKAHIEKETQGGVHVGEDKTEFSTHEHEDAAHDNADVSESMHGSTINKLLEDLARTEAEKRIKKLISSGNVKMEESEVQKAVDEIAQQILEEVKEGKKDGKETLDETMEKLAQKEEEAEPAAKIEGECILFSQIELSAEVTEQINSGLKVSFQKSTDEEAAKALGVTMPGLYYKSDEGEYVFNLSEEENTSENIATKISKSQDIARVPVFGELYRENSHLYENLSVPIVYFVAKKPDFDNYKWAAPIAESLKSHLKIAMLDYITTEFFLNISGVNGSMLPALFIIVPKDQRLHKYLLTNVENDKRTEEFLQQCAYDISSVEPYLMGEPRPSEENMANEAGVVNIVACTFNEIALNPKVDTLVVYYAEWCSFCKNLLPGLDKIAAALKKASSDVVISRMLMSKNDVPLQKEVEPIQAYPTIRIYQKETNKEIEFEIQDKPADAESVLAFLKAHTNIPADLTLEDSAETEKKAAPTPEAQIPQEVKVDL